MYSAERKPKLGWRAKEEFSRGPKTKVLERELLL